MEIERLLYREALKLLEKRYPVGWGGAAAMYTEDGSVLTSVAPEVINASTELCIETGSICEAHKFGKVVTHTLCLVRDKEDGEIKILPPCGVCQERLFYWGDEVKAAVQKNGNVEFMILRELQPYHWYKAYSE